MTAEPFRANLCPLYFNRVLNGVVRRMTSRAIRDQTRCNMIGAKRKTASAAVSPKSHQVL